MFYCLCVVGELDDEEDQLDDDGQEYLEKLDQVRIENS